MEEKRFFASAQEDKELGTFFVNVTTKKGMFSPVRRSHRNKRKDEVSSSRNDTEDKENRDRSNIVRKKKEQAVSVDELCTMFQTTMTVNNATLDSKQETVRLSPMPKKGRVTNLEHRDGKLNAVRRSTRKKN